MLPVKQVQRSQSDNLGLQMRQHLFSLNPRTAPEGRQLHILSHFIEDVESQMMLFSKVTQSQSVVNSGYGTLMSL